MFYAISLARILFYTFRVISSLEVKKKFKRDVDESGKVGKTMIELLDVVLSCGSAILHVCPIQLGSQISANLPSEGQVFIFHSVQCCLI